MGSLGSLVSMWLRQQGSLQLFLLGRSGRAGSGNHLGHAMSGEALVSMARSDVASSEEAAYIAHAAGRTGSGALRVRTHLSSQSTRPSAEQMPRIWHECDI